VVVTNVQSTTLPALDDEFAKEASKFDTLKDWQSNMKTQLQEQATASYAEDFDNQILDQILATSTIKYPPQMVENEVNEMVRSLEYRLSQQGMTKELYLQIRGMDEDAFFEEMQPMAEERLKRALVLFEIAQKEEIEIDPAKVQSETLRTFDAISNQMTPNEAKKLTQSQFIPNLMTNITADLTSQTTMDFLRATAKGEPWPAKEEETEEKQGKKEAADEVVEDAETPGIEEEKSDEMTSDPMTDSPGEEPENNSAEADDELEPSVEETAEDQTESAAAS
jgi:trigger factor